MNKQTLLNDIRSLANTATNAWTASFETLGSLNPAVRDLAEIVTKLHLVVEMVQKQQDSAVRLYQSLPPETLKSWLDASQLWSGHIYHATENCFYVTFGYKLTPEDKRHLKGLGFDIEETTLPNRYMLVWRKPIDDEA